MPAEKIITGAGRPSWEYRVRHAIRLTSIFGAVAGIVIGAHHEATQSTLQSKILGRMASGELLTTVSTQAPPAEGPYDIRLGYGIVPAAREKLRELGYLVTDQKPWPQHCITSGLCLFPLYNEKAQAGLSLDDSGGNTLHKILFPQKAYASFDSIPPVLWKSLAFVEDRQLLESHPDTWNPAVNFGRLAYAIAGQAGIVAESGGSGFAIQTEKSRHSPGGITSSAVQKARQLLSASLKATARGSSESAIQSIILEWINNMPLAARPHFGEVIGFADGMKGWFGRDFDTVNRILRDAEKDPEAAAPVLKEALALGLSVLKPSIFHGSAEGRAELEQRINLYLPLLAESGLISSNLMQAAQKAPLLFAAPPEPPKAAPPKWETHIRTNLMEILDASASGLPALDKMDIRVRSTVNGPVNDSIAGFLASLKDPAVAIENKLTGPRLLNPQSASRTSIAVTIFESTPEGNMLRVQADSFPGAFNPLTGSKMELGSTAKLRFLATYLEYIADLHDQYAESGQERLEAATEQARLFPDDRMTAWALDYLSDPARNHSLAAMLEAALERTYSGNPAEVFFTGGGRQRYANYTSEENGRFFNLKDAFKHSVNLVFIRLAREIRFHNEARKMGITRAIFDDPDNPLRHAYLDRFIDFESLEYLNDFWREQKGKTPEELITLLARKTPLKQFRVADDHLAAIFYYMHPDIAQQTQGTDEEISLADMNAFIGIHCPACSAGNDREGYDAYLPDKMNLNDRAYVTGLHPLELWLAQYLSRHPDATWEDIKDASHDVRFASYDYWLKKPAKKRIQDSKIATMLEKDASRYLNETWHKTGYPFDVVPSDGSALGSSGDRPDALARLAGIIINGGRDKPTYTFSEIFLGEGTPYELKAMPSSGPGKQVMRPDVARLLLREMQNVVNGEGGTAARARNAIVQNDGTAPVIGGKTGTGANIGNRTATLVFTVGARFYGCITLYLPDSGPNDKFTSAIAAQLLHAIGPYLAPLFDPSPKNEATQDLVQKQQDPNVPPEMTTLPAATPSG